MPRFSDLEMVNGMRAAAEAAGRSWVNQGDYERFRAGSEAPLASVGAIRRRFGSWDWAAAHAGLRVSGAPAPEGPLGELCDPELSPDFQAILTRLLSATRQEIEGPEAHRAAADFFERRARQEARPYHAALWRAASRRFRLLAGASGTRSGSLADALARRAREPR